MKTIGELIREIRIRKKYSREKLEKATKIKKEFIEAIEKENWEVLPEYPVVQGFIKNIARTLKFDPRQVVAILRRDYPPKKLTISPKPDISKRFSWSPRLTFLTGVVLVLIVVLGYLVYQYLKFLSPPSLEVYQPDEGQVITEVNLVISGRTDPSVVVKVNNQPILVDNEGHFSDQIEIYERTDEIEFRAISRSGKETIIRRKIVPKLEN